MGSSPTPSTIWCDILRVMKVTSQLSAPESRVLPGGLALLKSSIALYRAHWQLITGVVAIPFAIGALSPLFTLITQAPLPIGVSGFFGLVELIVAFFSTLALFNVVVFHDTVRDVGDAYARGWKFTNSFVWVSILSSLAVVGGLFLFIIPAIIVGILLSMNSFILIAEGERGMRALVKSWYYVRGSSLDMVWRNIFFGIIVSLLMLITGSMFGFPHVDFRDSASLTALASTPTPPLKTLVDLFVNQFIVAPFAVLYFYFLYLAFRESRQAPLPDAETMRIRTYITRYMIVAGVGMALLFLFSGYVFFHFLFNVISGFPTPLYASGIFTPFISMFQF